MEKVRIDKWLWAARFFKTRNLAKNAIDGGKVHIDGQRVKASKEVSCHTLVRIRIGWDEREVEIMALSDQRKGAPYAATLYRETEASIGKRQQREAERKAAGAQAATPNKPNTKQRRQLQQIKRILDTYE